MSANGGMRTPLGKVRGLGPAKSGSKHFWWQRVTGVANLCLVVFMLFVIIGLVGADHATVKQTLSAPLVAVLLLLLILSGVYHMRLGMQVIIEDYISGEGLKIIALVLNTFFAIFVGSVCLFAVLKLSLGA
ncbi:MAG: succinate dehydrogenase, hydrophobic membrane anchor protein [Hyphomicrobiaceae bacterium]